ncbi:alpha/beta hydrolase [Thermoleptolyngbya sichuanensis A183]|uniref:Alpha/beta hydrolase n=1 Tax=Thermoleptolyngbya sichuanensis A183 TaxID=2737172 RepID=A0A6M8BDE8_9CYAN|nr:MULTISPECIES: alpha/beta hydrolase [Thermoleptolyngbya]MDG2617971.1 alpha/beta hydrolase [Thermoleptolyngbya sichuanensis XZ-Cy5]QKD82290.1 alpha/beta hydrolase [Thermoleptolyngbya sichuanensis A183]
MTLPIRNGRIRLSQGQIFWREVGQGVPIVLLHDTWSDGGEWLAVVDLLAEQYHCLMPDLLGFGESERPRLHYSVALEVDCLAEWLEALRLRRVSLVGVGVGAWVAASFALKHEEKVDGLVLLAPEGVKVVGAAQRWQGGRSLLSRVPLARWLLNLVAPVAKLLGWRSVLKLQERVRLWRRSPAASQILFNRRPVEIQAEYIGGASIDPTSGSTSGPTSGSTGTHGQHLSWLKAPLLLLQGDAESSLIAAQIRAYTDAPRAQVQTLPGQDLLQTAPEVVARSIHAFMRNNTPSNG